MCNAHKAKTQMLNLLKSLACSYALATLYGVTQKHIIKNNVERANVQQRVAKIGLDGSRFLTLYFSIWLHIQQDVINLTCAYHQLLLQKMVNVFHGKQATIFQYHFV